MNEKEHILIVDDDPNIAKSLAIILQHHGYVTSRAGTGHEALECARDTPLSLILLDIRLPDVQGLELIRPLKELRPDAAIVVITAYASLETAVQAVNEGASGYLKKPFGISDVLHAVNHAREQGRIVPAEMDGRLTGERPAAQEDLQESHDWFRMLFHRGNDAVFVHGVTAEGLPSRFLEVNDLACRNLGYSREELLKLSPLEIDGSEEGRDVRCVMARLLSDKYCVAEQVHVAKDGRKLLVETSAHLFELKGRTLVLSISRDISERKKSEEALRQSEERWRSLVENAPDIILTINRDGAIQFANRTLSGHPAQDPVSTSLYEWVLPEHGHRLRSTVDNVFAGSEAPGFEVAVRSADGRTLWYQGRVGTIGPKGMPTGCIMILTDITERKRADEIREASHRFLRIANRPADLGTLLGAYVAEVKRFIKCQAVGIRLLDEDGLIQCQAHDGYGECFSVSGNPLTACSDQVACINMVLGDTAGSPSFRTDGGSFLTHGTTRFLATLSEAQRGITCTVCNACGYESVALVPIRQGDRILGVIHLADPRESAIPTDALALLESVALPLLTSITRARTEERLAYLATHDALTGLPTRAEFERRLNGALAQVRSLRQGLAVMVADVDHFKHVNDTMGHDAGDRLLVAIGERLSSVLRSKDVAARIGGDEFVLVLDGIAAPSDAAAVATKLLCRIQEPFLLDAQTLRVTISIGIACCPSDGDNGTTLLKRADTAMYRAKNAGRNNYQWYNEPVIPGAN